MNHRFLSAVRDLAVGIAVVSLAPVPVAGQAPAAAKSTAGSKAWTPSRTPDGQPDMQGFWINGTYAPLERPDNVTNEFYTREEAAQFVREAAEREGSQAVPGTGADVHYDRAQFGLPRSRAGYAPNLRTSVIVDPPNGKLPPMSAEGQKRAAERAEARKRMGGLFDQLALSTDRELTLRCFILERSGPPMLSGNYNNTLQIVQTPGYVTVLVEMLHNARIIPLDGRSRLPQNVRQWTGSSRGRWEGDTLVVETANLNGKFPFRVTLARWTDTSENMRVTERFTRVDEETIRYQFTIDDPATWARPWSGEMPLERSVGPIFEHACHEGNYDLSHMLALTRAAEKRAAEEAAKKGSR